MQDRFTVATKDEHWTRATHKGALGLAQYLEEKGAKVTVHDQGNLIYETKDEFIPGAD